jgi:phosphoribosylglycinamide formyltransferase-1
VAEARIAVLASGEGTNLQALLDDPVVAPWVVLVVSDRAGAGALERARVHGVRAEHVDPASYDGRPAYDRALADLLGGEGVDLVVLAGFMRIVGPALVSAFEGRMLNVHPSLLPAFAGGSAVADALAWGVKVTGVTVHLVDEEVDHGPVVLQEAVDVRDDDTPDSLEERVHEVEHRLLPAAVRAVAEGRVVVEGRSVRVLTEVAG